jgi:hypothetical protein
MVGARDGASVCDAGRGVGDRSGDATSLARRRKTEWRGAMTLHHITARIAISASLAAFAPAAWAADADVERQMRAMQERMQQLDDQIQAADDQLQSATTRIEEQSELIDQAGLQQTRGASSGLPGFLGQITIGGNVVANYFWNLNDPDDGRNINDPAGGMNFSNSGLNGVFYPLHPDHNTFSLHQVWLEIERPIDEENRAGFRFDPVYGRVGALNNVGGLSNRENRDDTGLYINQGYVQYLAPIGDGVTLKAGKFGTTIGAESANSVENFNITHGSVYQLLEPLDHVGVMAEYTFGDSGFDAALAGVNGFFPDSPDRNEAKSILWHTGWANDLLSLNVNGIWGGEVQGFDGDESGVVNGLVTIDPTDKLSLWINGNYAWIDTEGDPYAWGVAAAGRYAVTDRTGVSLRAEYVADGDQYLGMVGFDPDDESGFAFTDIEVWGVTATVDHLLTDHLMIRGEVRYDEIDKDDTGDEEFLDEGGDFKDDQIVLGAEVIYNFNEFGGE